MLAMNVLLSRRLTSAQTSNLLHFNHLPESATIPHRQMTSSARRRHRCDRLEYPLMAFRALEFPHRPATCFPGRRMGFRNLARECQIRLAQSFRNSDESETIRPIKFPGKMSKDEGTPLRLVLRYVTTSLNIGRTHRRTGANDLDWGHFHDGQRSSRQPQI